MKTAVTVCRKEFREMLRDKRVVYSAFVGPVFLVLLFLFLFGFLQKTLKSPQAMTIHWVAMKHKPMLLAGLEASKKARIKTVESFEKGEELVRKGEARVVLRFPDNFDGIVASGNVATVDAVFDPEQPTSQIALSAVEHAVSEQSNAATKAIMRSKGISEEMADPVRLKRKEIKHEEAFGGILASLLPYLIVIWAFYGGFSVASDLVAGEKERSTLETLLITPADRVQIALGKFWALAALCVTSGLSSVVTVAVAGYLPIDMIQGLFPNGVHMSLGGVLAMLLVVVPLSGLFAGLLLALSAFARNSRECQGYLTLVSFIVIMPAVFSQFIGFTDFQRAMWVNFVPILNSANVLRNAIMGNLDWAAVGVTVGLNVVAAIVGVKVVVWLFNREQVLWRV